MVENAHISCVVWICTAYKSIWSRLNDVEVKHKQIDNNNNDNNCFGASKFRSNNNNKKFITIY